MSSNPTTLTSRGTRNPRSRTARMAPIAIASLIASTAVGRVPAAGCSEGRRGSGAQRLEVVLGRCLVLADGGLREGGPGTRGVAEYASSTFVRSRWQDGASAPFRKPASTP